MGSPIPLGFWALGAASVALSGLQLSWVPQDESHQIAIIVLAFAVPLELLASVFGFLSRDSVGGTGMGLLAGTWLATGTLLVTTTPGARSQTLGLLLFFVSAALMVPTCAAALGKVAAAIVLFAASARSRSPESTSTSAERAGSTCRVGGGSHWRLRPLRGFGFRGRRYAPQDHSARVATRLRQGSPGRDLDAELERIQHEAGVREQL